MCFTVSLNRRPHEIEEIFRARFISPELYEPFYYASAFSTPALPVVLGNENGNSRSVEFLRWGLIPGWVKDIEKAEKIRFQTANARAETIYEKPSFRGPILKGRCIVPVDGFYEWQEVRGRNYPYHIKLKDRGIFGLAGICDSWTHPEDNEVIRTFSIVTTRANPLMERIHNKKKRMPVILDSKDHTTWLNEGLEKEKIDNLLQPYDDSSMEAFTISPLISRRGVNRNVPEVMEPYDYEELHTKDLFSF